MRSTISKVVGMSVAAALSIATIPLPSPRTPVVRVSSGAKRSPAITCA
jgi:hypothetical protein